MPFVPDDQWNALVARVNLLTNWVRRFKITGPNVTGHNGLDTGCAYHVGPGRKEPPRQHFDDFYGYFQVTSMTQDGSNKRFVYQMKRMIKGDVEYGGWEEPDPTENIEAFNLVEEGNSSSGLWGNGVTSSNADPLSLVEVPTGKGIHRVYAVSLPGNGIEFWFEADNAVDGTC